MGDILTLQHIKMQFGGVTAIDDLNLTIGQEQIVAVIGPNGAGKTTAFNVITGIYRPTAGKVLYSGIGDAAGGESNVRDFGTRNTGEREPNVRDAGIRNATGQRPDGRGTALRDITGLRPDRIARLGIARTFQNIRLFAEQSVLDNILLGQHVHLKSGFLGAVACTPGYHREEREMRKFAMELLEEIGIADYAAADAVSLPYGIQRKLEIVRALASRPKLLLLDEPAAGMNPQETIELADFIREIRDRYKVSILLIEHHMDLIMEIAETIYVLDFGKLIASGSPEEIQTDPKVIAAYLGVGDD